MAIQAGRTYIWRHKGTASDRRLGFVEMTEPLARNEIVGGRAQDPMVGLLLLKNLDTTIPEPEGLARVADTTAPYRRNGKRNGTAPAPAPIEEPPAPAADPEASSSGQA